MVGIEQNKTGTDRTRPRNANPISMGADKMIQIEEFSSQDIKNWASAMAGGLTDFEGAGFGSEYQVALDELVQVLWHGKMKDVNTNILKQFVKNSMVAIMANRLKLVQFYKENPELLTKELKNPIFVVSLPRTGSTILHNVLSKDPNCRTLQQWELRTPFPSPEEGEPDPVRFAMSKKVLDEFKMLAPTLQGKHEVDYEDPEECWNGFVDPFSVAAYYASAEYGDEMRDAFFSRPRTHFWRNYRKVVTCLTLKKQIKSHLVMKNPLMLADIANAYESFPEAKFVFCHRDPSKSLPSMTSLNEEVQDVLSYAPAIDLHRWGARTKATFEHCLEQGLADRALLESKGVKFVDFHYSNFTKNPMSAISDLYAALDIDFTTEAKVSIEAYLAEQKQKSKTRKTHTYSLEKYGITEESMEEAFGDYMRKFNVQPEHTRQFI